MNNDIRELQLHFTVEKMQGHLLACHPYIFFIVFYFLVYPETAHVCVKKADLVVMDTIKGSVMWILKYGVNYICTSVSKSVSGRLSF